jgi:hypothetical protein
MEKKTHKYHLTLTGLPAGSADGTGKIIEFDFENHDEIFQIIDRLREKNPFDNPDQMTEFAIGLKLFSEVMIKNRKHPLFEELGPAFGNFMKRLKSL